MANTDTLSPVYVGDRSIWTLPQVDRNNKVKSLAGVSAGAILLKLQSQTDKTIVLSLTGTATIAGDGTSGILSFAPSAQDVATIGNYYLWVIVPWVSGTPQHSDPYVLDILAAP